MSSSSFLHLVIPRQGMVLPDTEGEITLCEIAVRAETLHGFLETMRHMSAAQQILQELGGHSHRVRGTFDCSDDQLFVRHWLFDYHPDTPGDSRVSRLLTGWLNNLRDSSDFHKETPVQSTLLEQLESVMMPTPELEISPSRVAAHSLEKFGSSSRLAVLMQFSPTRIYRYLSYLVSDQEIKELWGEWAQRRPRDLLSFLDEGCQVLGVPDEKQRSLPALPTAIATQLLQHSNQDVRQRAITVLKNRDSFHTNSAQQQARSQRQP